MTKEILDRARDQFASDRSDVLRRLLDLERCKANLELLVRTKGQTGEIRSAKLACDEALTKVNLAQRKAQAARDTIHAALADYLQANIELDIAKLEDRYPIVLLPVRLETRFIDRTLKIRIYPDTIHFDRHEPQLTETEYKAGIEYWTKVWPYRSNSQDYKPIAQNEWRRLLRLRSAQRTAWIVEQTKPENIEKLHIEGEDPIFRSFTEDMARSSTWSRPVEARLLPDRWLALAYRGGVEIHCKESSPILEPLALSFDPGKAVPEDLDDLERIREDPDAGWLVNFQRAEDVGMAITIEDLTDLDLEEGFSRILVLGVKTSLDHVQSSEALAALFDAHHYTDGLAFVRQGTPTNNTQESPSGYPRRDPDGRITFDIERGVEWGNTQKLEPNHDGYLVSSALRLPPAIFDYVERARPSWFAGESYGEQEAARAMNDVLWPATLGYFIEQMLAAGIGERWLHDRVVDRASMQALREFFVQYVHGRGPYPAFRVGTTPYGLLPVTSIERWQWGGAYRLRVWQLGESINEYIGHFVGTNQSWNPPLPINSAILLTELASGTLEPAAMLVTEFTTGIHGLELVILEPRLADNLAVIHIYHLQSTTKRTIEVDLRQNLSPQSHYLDGAGVAVGDIDRDGQREMVVYYQIYERIDESTIGAKATMYYQVSSDNGSNWSDPVAVTSPYERDVPRAAITLADVNNDSILELVVLGFKQETEQAPVSPYLGVVSIMDYEHELQVHKEIDATFSSINASALCITDTGNEISVFIDAFAYEPSDEIQSIYTIYDLNFEVIGEGKFPSDNSPARTLSAAVTPYTLLPNGLKLIRNTWLTASKQVARVGNGSTDPDINLLQILSSDASAREVYYRAAVGGDFLRGFYNFRNQILPNGWQSWSTVQEQLMNDTLQTLGVPFATFVNRPERERLRLFELVFNPVAHRFTNGLVTNGDNLSETDPVDYIRDFMNTPPVSVDGQVNNLRDLQNDNLPLFWLMLRHSILLEYFDKAIDVLVKHGIVLPSDVRRERELIGINPNITNPEDELFWYVLEYPLQDGKKVGEALWQQYTFNHSRYFESLYILGGLPQSEVYRLFTETLDICSHRIDAWITALATWRLDMMRPAANDNNVYIGAYGWVEDLKPASANTTTEETIDNIKYAVQTNNGGYIHAPSLDHAATAAILRNGYLSRSGVDHTRLAVDLSSERVRIGRQLVDAVRQGQPLGAYLGYRVERLLHENQLDQYIEPLRHRFPLVPAAPDRSPAPVESTVARNVVDGFALRQAWMDTTHMNWGKDGLPEEKSATYCSTNPSDDYCRLQSVLNGELGYHPPQGIDPVQIDPLDAASDLLTAESIFQMVRGNPTASSAALDALSRGVRAPDPEISHTFRSGIPLTHRIAVIMNDNQLPATWTANPTARAQIEPRLNAWIGSLIVNPEKIVCYVHYPAELRLVDVKITLAMLNLHPLDILAQDGQMIGQVSELNQRIAYHALTLLNPPSTVTINQIVIDHRPRANTKGEWTFPELLELTRTINSVIGAAQPLRPDHLGAVDTAATITDDTAERANAAVLALEGHIASLNETVETMALILDPIDLSQPSTQLPTLDATQLNIMRNVLMNISQFGFADAVPETASDTSVAAAKILLAQARSVLTQAQQRIKDANNQTDPHEKVRELFKSKIMMFSAFTLSAPNELIQALTTGPKYAATPPTAAEQATIVQKWLLGAARIRPALDKWRRLWLYMGARRSRATPKIAQLPYDPADYWVALPFTEDSRPLGGRISLALYSEAQPTNMTDLAGLLIDEWAELIPNREETTGLAFHYDDPGAEPPQAVLIAVSPTPPQLNGSTKWNLDTLVSILHETMDLAHIRAVDGEMLGGFGQLLPGVLLAANQKNETISTPKYET